MKTMRLAQITVRDKKLFQYNSDVMNECFGGNYNTYFNDAVKNVYGGCVWFPKERVKDRYGNWQPGSKEVNWKNYLSDDGKKVIMYVDPGETAKDSRDERPERPTEAVPCHTFMKSSNYDNYYKYVGTFMVDLNASTGDCHIFRRLKDNANLSIWYEGHNEGYYEIDGNPAFSEMYLGGDFQKHIKYIKAYDFASENALYEEKVKTFRTEYGIGRIIKLGEVAFKGEFLNALKDSILSVYHEEVTLNDLYPSGHTFTDIAGAYVPLITADGDFNSIIKNTILDAKIAGMVMGIYNSFAYIYGLSTERIESCLEKVRYNDIKNETRIEKCNLLYFWKQCMVDLDDYSIPSFVGFIESL